MIVEHKEDQTVIKDAHDNIDSFLEDLLNKLTDFKDQNVIIDLTHNSNITSTSIKQFVSIQRYSFLVLPSVLILISVNLLIK